MLSTRDAETDFHATAKVLAGARGGRGEEFLPDVPFFCIAILVGSWKGPQLALPSGNCSFSPSISGPPSCPLYPGSQRVRIRPFVSQLQLRLFVFFAFFFLNCCFCGMENIPQCCEHPSSLPG